LAIVRIAVAVVVGVLKGEFAGGARVEVPAVEAVLAVEPVETGGAFRSHRSHRTFWTR
jgi:hypothetical protein